MVLPAKEERAWLVLSLPWASSCKVQRFLGAVKDSGVQPERAEEIQKPKQGITQRREKAGHWYPLRDTAKVTARNAHV